MPWAADADSPSKPQVIEDDDLVRISTVTLEAAIAKRGYVSGVARQSLLDKKTGFRDPGFGLDIVDWIMEPGSDEAYRSQLTEEMVYRLDGRFALFHGATPKRSIEGPQICTQARSLSPQVRRGKDFVGIEQQYRYRTSAPGRQTGSLWTQRLVFPNDKRYFLSMDRIDAVNSSEAMFLRIDMPGHVRHRAGDSFSEIYLSYHGRIPSQEFAEDFAPDARFAYRRGAAVPERFIRAVRLRDPQTGKQGPWLAGMVLEPADVAEAWCHQRGYVCMILEFGGRPVKAGESFSAAFIVGYFDSIDEMHQVYDAHRGHSGLDWTADRWRLTR